MNPCLGKKELFFLVGRVLVGIRQEGKERHSNMRVFNISLKALRI